MLPVDVIDGKNKNIILIAPHGNTDTNTDKLTKKLAKKLNVRAVINNAWKKSNTVNESEYLGNCNNIDHIDASNAMQSEFFDPIENFINVNEQMYIFNIHGCKNIKDVELILGFGLHKQENKSRLTIVDKNYKNKLIYNFNKMFSTYIGLSDGKYGAYSSKHLNQVLSFSCPKINIIQLEFSLSLRIKNIDKTVEKIYYAIYNSLMNTSKPSDKELKIYNDFYENLIANKTI